jgi:hypothetical protein
VGAPKVKPTRFFSLRPLLNRSGPKPVPGQPESEPESAPAVEEPVPTPRPLRPGDLDAGDRDQLLAVLRSQQPPVAPPISPPDRKDHLTMASNIDTILKEAMQIDGAIGVALVDYTSGMTLGQSGGGILNLEVAAAGNTEVVRAKLRTMEALGLRESIEDILITLDTQYHLIRLITDRSGHGLFLYMALDKHRSNLALARRKLANLERAIQI